MSLQVWLPLNGNADNQGLCGPLTTSGITFADGGKIGAKYLSAGTITIPAAISDTFFNKDHMSFAFWLYPIGTSGSNLIMGQNAMAVGNNRMYSMFQYSTPNNLHLSWQDETSSGAFMAPQYTNFFPADTWTHCCITYDGAKARIYRNGELYIEVNGVSNRTAFNYDFPIYGSSIRKLNDVRIYDHILSVKEIKELSKGLVLHYKLKGQGTPNLLQGDYRIYTTNTNSNATGSLIWDTTKMPFSSVPGKTFIYTYDYSIEGDKANNTGNWQHDRYGIRISVSYDENSPIKTPVYPGTDYLTVSGTGRAIQTFTIPSNAIVTNIAMSIQPFNKPASGNNATWYLRNIKIEEGTVDNGWSANPGTDLGYGIEYDCSGYGNDGTIVGTLTNSSDSPRYNASTVFPSGANYINAGQGAKITDMVTVNLWVNYSTWGNPISCTEGGGWNFENSNGIQFPVYVASVGYKVANSGVAPDTLKDSWHMLTGTFDKTNVKIYIDGVLKATAATGSTNGIGYNNNNAIFIGAEAAGTTTSPASTAFIGNISDVRIYATALSADDVLELYHTSASIDNQGNLYCGELVE